MLIARFNFLEEILIKIQGLWMLRRFHWQTFIDLSKDRTSSNFKTRIVQNIYLGALDI